MREISGFGGLLIGMTIAHDSLPLIVGLDCGYRFYACAVTDSQCFF